jgi:hypothetical protein
MRSYSRRARPTFESLCGIRFSENLEKGFDGQCLIKRNKTSRIIFGFAQPTRACPAPSLPCNQQLRDWLIPRGCAGSWLEPLPMRACCCLCSSVLCERQGCQTYLRRISNRQASPQVGMAFQVSWLLHRE